MTDSKWAGWFIVSTIWLLMHFFVLMITSQDQLPVLGHNFMFVFGLCLSILNLLFCVYVGSQPSESK